MLDITDVEDISGRPRAVSEVMEAELASQEAAEAARLAEQERLIAQAEREAALQAEHDRVAAELQRLAAEAAAEAAAIAERERQAALEAAAAEQARQAAARDRALARAEAARLAAAMLDLKIDLPRQQAQAGIDLGDLGRVLSRVAHQASVASVPADSNTTHWEPGAALRDALAAERRPQGAALDLSLLGQIGKNKTDRRD